MLSFEYNVLYLIFIQQVNKLWRRQPFYRILETLRDDIVGAVWL